MVNKYQDKKTFSYRRDQLFDLVVDVERYPEFLPWAKASRTIERHDNYLIADLLISFKGIDEKYRSRVSFSRPNVIEVQQVKGEGPFKTLHSKWEFSAVPGGGSELSFFIEFEFRHFLLRNVMGAVFAKAQHTMMEAFEKRAHELYGGE